MLVTSLRDGMNLVAKEYIACRHDESGALVLSEFTGAADELGSAFRPKLEQPTREACPTLILVRRHIGHVSPV